jgi:hypothetical protein
VSVGRNGSFRRDRGVGRKPAVSTDMACTPRRDKVAASSPSWGRLAVVRKTLQPALSPVARARSTARHVSAKAPRRFTCRSWTSPTPWNAFSAQGGSRELTEVRWFSKAEAGEFETCIAAATSVWVSPWTCGAPRAGERAARYAYGAGARRSRPHRAVRRPCPRLFPLPGLIPSHEQDCLPLRVEGYIQITLYG